jgi:XRE family transcriptional regulator, regulator of sulfur utilization
MQPCLKLAGLTLALIAGTMSCKKSEAGDTPGPLLASAVHDFASLEVTPTDRGTRRAVFDGRSATVDRAHTHITTLNPGQVSGEPRRHVQEEVIIIKEGSIEANWDGQSKIANAGSVIYFASGATTFLRNVGTTPATYYVIYYYTPLTPKE